MEGGKGAFYDCYRLEMSLSEHFRVKSMNRVRGAIQAAISNAAAQGKFHVFWKGDIPLEVEVELHKQGFVIELWHENTFDEAHYISWLGE